MLGVAHELFYWHGIRATGVDRVAAEAGVAPTTLYRLFASKDDLVAAYIERAGLLYREWFDAAAARAGRIRARRSWPYSTRWASRSSRSTAGGARS